MAWEDGWPVCAIPKPAIWADQGLGRRVFPRLSHACSRPWGGGGGCCCAVCQHRLSARPAPHTHPHFALRADARRSGLHELQHRHRAVGAVVHAQLRLRAVAPCNRAGRCRPAGRCAKRLAQLLPRLELWRTQVLQASSRTQGEARGCGDAYAGTVPTCPSGVQAEALGGLPSDLADRGGASVCTRCARRRAAGAGALATAPRLATRARRLHRRGARAPSTHLNHGPNLYTNLNPNLNPQPGDQRPRRPARPARLAAALAAARLAPRARRLDCQGARRRRPNPNPNPNPGPKTPHT